MTNKLCRICLCTDKELVELNDNLLDHFQDICDFTSGFSKHMSCSDCKESLIDNLDFRNQCLESNKILLEWKKKKLKDLTTIKSLHKLLQESLKQTKIKLEKNTKNNYEFYNVENDCYNIQIKEEIEDEMENSLCEVKNESIDDKMIDNELVDNKIIDNELVDNKTIDNELANNKMMNNGEFIDNDSVDIKMEDQNLLDYSDEMQIDKSDEDIDLKSNYKKKCKKRVYLRKGLSEYLQYEEVFDIKLFKTDEEARQELLSRRECEPYLSAAHRCELCYTVYKCHKLLQFHMKWHDGPGEFVCDICSMRFALRKSLYCHKARCHRGRFACKLCPVITYYGSAMKAHSQKHQGKTFKCHCGRVFKHISSYLSHKRTVHASSHVCVTCARTFLSEVGLFIHRVRAHQTKSKVDDNATARCAPCELTFTNQQVYTMHVLNTQAHSDDAKDIIGCPHCGLLFDDVAQLRSHKRLKHPTPSRKRGNDVIKCKLCDASGVGRLWRRSHYRAKHPLLSYIDQVTDGRLFMCDKCGKRFTNITLMKEHVNAHLGIKPYPCGRCRATFSNKAVRHVHEARHLTRDTAQGQNKRRRMATSVSTEVTNESKN